MVAYLVFAGFVVLLTVGFVVFGTDLPVPLDVAVAGLATAVVAVVGLRVARMGTVVTADGVTRRGFLGDRRHRWSDIAELALHDNKGVTTVAGIPVTSRFVVTVHDPRHRRPRTLVFLDERAFAGVAPFLGELTEIGQLWESRRHG
jgi:PH (Pleckstrin Homology) domain-containing protein